MAAFIDEVVTPYVDKQRRKIERPSCPVLLIYAFRAHSTANIVRKLKAINGKLVMVPKNMTDHPQPLDLAVNKPVKNFMKDQFTTWYSQKVVELKQLGEQSYDNLSELLKSVVTLRQNGAEWLINMYRHFQAEPQKQIIRNGFRKAGIAAILDSGPVDFIYCYVLISIVLHCINSIIALYTVIMIYYCYNIVYYVI